MRNSLGPVYVLHSYMDPSGLSVSGDAADTGNSEPELAV